MRLGAAITIIGMVFCLIALAPLATGEDLPSWLWWMAMSTGIGLALVLLGLHRAAAARRAEVSNMMNPRTSDLPHSSGSPEGSE
jgi:membrane protein implicated in regulation of membrane protease activity